MAAKRPAKRASRTPKKRARAKDWAPVFLQAFADTHLVTEAAKLAGIGRRTAYDRREADPSFAEKWSEIEERSTEQLEREAVRRAADGVYKPIYYKGELVDTVLEYSDTLLIFLLKARRPDVYREHHKIEHSGPEGGPIAAELVVDAKEAADAAHDFVQRLAGADG